MDWTWGKEAQFRSDVVPQVGLDGFDLLWEFMFQPRNASRKRRSEETGQTDGRKQLALDRFFKPQAKLSSF
jgi:hypothetical protein